MLQYPRYGAAVSQTLLRLDDFPKEQRSGLAGCDEVDSSRARQLMLLAKRHCPVPVGTRDTRRLHHSLEHTITLPYITPCRNA